MPHPTGHIGPNLRRHPCLSRAVTSASSQVNHIFRRSLLTTPLQFALGRPDPLLYPRTCQYTVFAAVCAGGPYGKHVQASEVVFFLSVCCPWFGKVPESELIHIGSLDFVNFGGLRFFLDPPTASKPQIMLICGFHSGRP